MGEEVKEERKKRLSPDATILLTLGACALAVVVYTVVHFIVA